MEENKKTRRAMILFPQSTIGKSIFYIIFAAQILMYIFRAFTLPDKSLTADLSMRSILGMMTDIITGVGANLILFWVVRWMLVKFKALKVRENSKTQFRYFFAMMIAIGIISFISIPHFVSKEQSLKKNPPATSSVDNLSSDEKARFREILTSVIQSEESFTPDIHAEFWRLLRKMDVVEGVQARELKETMTSVSGKYQRYLWEDAQQSLRSGRPFKSSQRENFEKYLQSTGGITDFRISQNEEFIVKVAQKKPMSVQGQEVLITEEMIKETLSNLESSAERVDKLFTP